jgi:hypothetical protein
MFVVMLLPLTRRISISLGVSWIIASTVLFLFIRIPLAKVDAVGGDI